MVPLAGGQSGLIPCPANRKVPGGQSGHMVVEPVMGHRPANFIVGEHHMSIVDDRYHPAVGQAGHAQFVVATHSPILMSCPGADILSFDHVPIKSIRYEDTEHFKVYRRFFESI